MTTCCEVEWVEAPDLWAVPVMATSTPSTPSRVHANCNHGGAFCLRKIGQGYGLLQ